MLLENFTTSPRAAGTGYGFVPIQQSQAELGSVLQLRLRFVPCVRGTELRDLQEVTNLARIRWGPCTRARALPHLPRVTQSGSESRRGETPRSVEGPGAAPGALEGFALHKLGLMAQPLSSSLCHHHHHHRAAIIITVPPSSSSSCHHHHHCATATMPLLSSPCHCCRHHCAAAAVTVRPPPSSLHYCHHHQDTAIVTMPPLSSSCHCHRCCATTLTLGEPPFSSAEWQKLPQHPQCPLSIQTRRAP